MNIHEDRDHLARLVAEGKTNREIGAIFGVTASTVSYWRIKHEIPRVYVSHGTAGRYKYHRCRCDVCVKAATKRRLVCGRKAKERVQAGIVPTIRKHGYSAYMYHMCRCDVCVAAARQRFARIAPTVEKYHKRANDESREHAERLGYIWTGPELELISRTDLTARQCAERLGRTISAVKNQRHQLKAGIPKKLRTRGLVGDDAPH